MKKLNFLKYLRKIEKVNAMMRHLLILLLVSSKSYALEKCRWDNRDGVPCVTISKTLILLNIILKKLAKKFLQKNR